ncbi:MAG TPA: K(+)-transporting ATPase subunit C [bacterium]
MSTIVRELRVAIWATVSLTVLLCGVYPLLVWGLAQALFPRQANGSLVYGAHGQVVGSGLLAQAFTSSRYFHSRPSAAGNGYDAANSGGSNLGPLSQKLDSLVAERVAAYRAENNLPVSVLIPVDAVTASGSGLDPHISVANARLQAVRVAQARGLNEAVVRRLIYENTQGPQWGILGEAGVNVLKVNLALDRIP